MSPTDSLCLVTQMPRSSDLVIFALTTDILLYPLLRMHTWGIFIVCITKLVVWWQKLRVDRDEKPFLSLGQIPETTTPDCEAKESESDIQFQCPCGKCSLETYLQNGCSQSCIPYLGMTTLSKMDKEDLNFILKKDTKKIMNSFNTLFNKTCDSLIQQEVAVERLVRVAVGFDPSLRNELKKSKSINEVFIDLAPEMSFFNHEILANIIDVLGDKDDKERLVHYSKDFQEFCKRKIFEVQPGCCTCGKRLSKLKQRKCFAVVIPKDEKGFENLEDAVSIKETLSDVLCVPLASLHLHRIDKGCIILVFSVPDSIAQELFPLPKEKLALLREKGVVLFVPQDLTYEPNQVYAFLIFSREYDNYK